MAKADMYGMQDGHAERISFQAMYGVPFDHSLEYTTDAGGNKVERSWSSVMTDHWMLATSKYGLKAGNGSLMDGTQWGYQNSNNGAQFPIGKPSLWSPQDYPAVAPNSVP